MFEREGFYSPGVDVYYRKMFEVLKIVSEKVGFDAWYYFAVENPLKFLGFIEDGQDKIKDCGKAMEKFNAHKNFIINKLGINEGKKSKETIKFLKDSGIINPKKIEEKIDMFLGSDGKKKYPGCKNEIQYTGYVNLINLKDIRDMKDKSGNILITKKAEAE